MIDWAVYDRLTGQILDELPGLRVTSSVSQIMGRGDQITVEIPATDRLPADWLAATQPGRAIIAGSITGDAPEDTTVLWGGWVERRSYGSGPVIQLVLQPVEEWLARSYIPPAIYRSVAYTTIARGIGLDALAATFAGEVVEVESPGRGDRTYEPDADMTRLTGLQNLMRTEHAIEWCTSWRLDAAGRLRLVVSVAPRLGRRAPHGGAPAVLLSGVDWSITDDYADGRGATICTGTATREGDDRLTVTRRDDALIGQGWLPLERRWAPDTGSVSEPVIAGYVATALAGQRLGTSTLDVSVHLDDCVPTRDFAVGDDIAIDLQAPDLPGVDTSLTVRLLGWVADPDPVSGEIVEIKPILTLDT